MDLNKISEAYFGKIFEDASKDKKGDIKAKVLLVDKYTTPIISMSYTQSQLLQQDIILIEFIEKQHELNLLKHLNCIVYIKPTTDSLQFLKQELRHPHFNKYDLFLNNSISKPNLEKIAEADEFESVNKIHEVFQDYLVTNWNLFTTNTNMNSPNPYIEESNSLISLLLSLKKCPIIKFESNSSELRKLSSEILYNINTNSNNNLFDDINKSADSPPLLLLLDRKNDPITPLIMPWTYQSMIHESIGINRNIVDLKENKEQSILSEKQDAFFKEAMYLNYGDLTDKFQRYVEEYKKQTKQSSAENLKTQNLSDLKRMLTKFPEFKKLSNNILKHLNIISEIDRQISNQHLWEVGELQQLIVCNLENHQSIKTQMANVLSNPQIHTIHKIKLILLYSIRFEDDIASFVNTLSNPEMSHPFPTEDQLALLNKFKRMFSSSAIDLSNDAQNNGIGKLFTNNKISINQLFQSNTSKAKTDNIFMQYVPKLESILTKLTKRNNEGQQGASSLTTLIPDKVLEQYGKNVDQYPVQNIIIFIKGGVTYEEARLVNEAVKDKSGLQVVIGGDSLLNSQSWMQELYESVNEIPATTSLLPTNDRKTQLRDIL